MFSNGFSNTPQPLSGSVIHRLKTSALDALYSQDNHSLIPADWNSGNCDVTLNFYKHRLLLFLHAKRVGLGPTGPQIQCQERRGLTFLFVGFTLHRVGGLPERQVSTGEMEQAHAVVTGCL